MIVAYEAIQYPQPLVPQVRCIHSGQEHTVMTVLPRKEWAKTVPCMDKRTKRETQNYDRDEQELVRVEERYIVQIPISTISDTYYTFLLMLIQHQSRSHLLSFG